MSKIKIDNECNSYFCENGHLHDYSKSKLEELEKYTIGKAYNSIDELKEDIENN